MERGVVPGVERARHCEGALEGLEIRPLVAVVRAEAREVDVGQIEDACAVRRPARVAALDEEPVVRAVGVHDPQRRLPFVFDLVHPAARVHDLGAVGRDLGIGHLLPVEVMVHGEQGVGGRFLGGRPRSRHREEQQRET